MSTHIILFIHIYFCARTYIHTYIHSNAFILPDTHINAQHSLHRFQTRVRQSLPSASSASQEMYFLPATLQQQLLLCSVSRSDTRHTLLCLSQQSNKRELVPVADLRRAGQTTDCSQARQPQKAARHSAVNGNGRKEGGFSRRTQSCCCFKHIRIYVNITRRHCVFFFRQSSQTVTNILSCPPLSAVTDSPLLRHHPPINSSLSPPGSIIKGIIHQGSCEIYISKKKNNKKKKQGQRAPASLLEQEDGSDFKLFVHTMTMRERKMNLLYLLEGTKETFQRRHPVERSFSFQPAHEFFRHVDFSRKRKAFCLPKPRPKLREGGSREM